MTTRFQLLFFIFFTMVMIVVGSRPALGASSVGTYTVTPPANTTVTMGDASVTLSFSVANGSGSSGSVGYIKIEFDGNIYYMSNATVAPSGWSKTIKNAGAGQTYVEFSTSTVQIAPGGNETFDIVIVGSNDTNITSAASDQTDTLNAMSVKVSSAGGANFFDLSAAILGESQKR